MNLHARNRTVWQAYSFEDPRTFLSMGNIQGEGRSQGTNRGAILEFGLLHWVLTNPEAADQAGDTERRNRQRSFLLVWLYH
jgi:hypothetical protein